VDLHLLLLAGFTGAPFIMSPRSTRRLGYHKAVKARILRLGTPRRHKPPGRATNTGGRWWRGSNATQNVLRFSVARCSAR
jgi:hypothetical protein